MVSDFGCDGFDGGADSHEEFFQIAKDATAEPIVSQVAKETLHPVQPRGTGGSEVQRKARVSSQPALHVGMFMGRVVVANQGQLPVGRNRRVDEAEKLQPLL